MKLKKGMTLIYKIETGSQEDITKGKSYKIEGILDGYYVEFYDDVGDERSWHYRHIESRFKVIPNTINPNFRHYVSSEKLLKLDFNIGDKVKYKKGKAVYELLEFGSKNCECRILFSSQGEKIDYGRIYKVPTEKLIKELR